MMTIKFPVNQIAAGIKAVRETKVKLVSIDEELHEYGETEEDARKYKGEEGVQIRTQELEKGNQRKAAIISETRERLDSLREEALNYIEGQTDPDGKDIIGDNAPDFALLEHNLIESPEKLERLLAKHNNPAFHIAAQHYAKAPSREWAGFNFSDNVTEIKAYTNQVFDRLNDAAGNPYGINYMQYAETPDEYARIAEAYGLKKAFLESGGDYLKDL